MQAVLGSRASPWARRTVKLRVGCLRGVTTGILLAQVAAGGVTVSMGPDPSAPTNLVHSVEKIEGWTVRVDTRLDEPLHAELGRRARDQVACSLRNIKTVVPADKVCVLQRVTIQVDLDHGRLRLPQYHPSPVWLQEHGYATSLVRCVHVPRAEHLIDPKEFRREPWVLLHELAHAYHHQVLGYNYAPILAAWERAKASGKYEQVLHVFGGRTRHYLLTDAKEFFAEMTEVYFGVNDFYPFIRAELEEYDPETAALLRAIWETPLSDCASNSPPTTP